MAVLAKDATLADAGALHNVRKVPDFGPGTEGRRLVDDRGRMDIDTGRLAHA